mgnify:CR=1 FL=1
MHQLRFEWVEQVHRTEPTEVDLAKETSEVVIVLMARVLIAVVRTSEEAVDEW